MPLTLNPLMFNFSFKRQVEGRVELWQLFFYLSFSPLDQLFKTSYIVSAFTKMKKSSQKTKKIFLSVQRLPFSEEI